MKTRIIFLLTSLAVMSCSPISRNVRHPDLVDEESFSEIEEDWLIGEGEEIQETEHIVMIEKGVTDVAPQWQQHPQRRRSFSEKSDVAVIPLMALAGAISGFPFDFCDAAFSSKKFDYKYTLRGAVIGTVLGIGVYYLVKDDEEIIITDEDLPFEK